MMYYVKFQNSDAGVERGNPEEPVTAGPFDPLAWLTKDEEWFYDGHQYTDVVMYVA